MKYLFPLFLLCMVTVGTLSAQPQLRWETPGENAAGSMPIGNGQVAANVWAATDGTISLYVARIDALSEIGRLLKVGRVDLRAVGCKDVTARPFTQSLDTQTGEVIITNDNGAFRIFVDADSPIIYVEGRAHSGDKLTVEVINNIWRTAPRTLSEAESRSVWSMQSAPDSLYKLIESADVPSKLEGAIAAYHRNESSTYPFTLDFQQLQVADRNDPYMNRTFGLCMAARDFVVNSPTELHSAKPIKDFTLKIAATSGIYPSAAEWEREALTLCREAPSVKVAAARTAAYWRSFWDRSHITVSTPDVKTGERITEAYDLQRWITACAGRGSYAIKFNGSLFTVDPAYTKAEYEGVNPDFRLWGECYWWQNTRLPYHPMLRTADTEMMLPLFEQYWRNMPTFKAIARDHYRAQGATIPETSTHFGTFGNRDYGWDRTGRDRGYVNNTYIKNMWNPALELVSMMLDYYDYTGDEEFARERLVPMAREFMLYFDSRFARNDQGVLQVTPTQSLETYWYDVVNDMPTVAGLRTCLPRLAALPEATGSATDRELWRRLMDATPVLPIKADGLYAPAGQYKDERSNVENPELYPIFPYHLINLASDPAELSRAVQTYGIRVVRATYGWSQDGQQAALLGLTDVARADLLSKIANSHPSHRFPAIWGPNYDWTPDQDHGGNLMTTLQDMVMQSYDGKIFLLPAFPADWSVDFKLATPGRGTVSGTFVDGLWTKAPKLQGDTKFEIIDVK